MFFTLIFGDNFFNFHFNKMFFAMVVVDKNNGQLLQPVPVNSAHRFLSKGHINQVKYVSQNVTLHLPYSLTNAMDDLFKYIGNDA